MSVNTCADGCVGGRSMDACAEARVSTRGSGGGGSGGCRCGCEGECLGLLAHTCPRAIARGSEGCRQRGGSACPDSPCAWAEVNTGRERHSGSGPGPRVWTEPDRDMKGSDELPLKPCRLGFSARLQSPLQLSLALSSGSDNLSKQSPHGPWEAQNR